MGIKEIPHHITKKRKGPFNKMSINDKIEVIFIGLIKIFIGLSAIFFGTKFLINSLWGILFILLGLILIIQTLMDVKNKGWGSVKSMGA